MYGKLSDIDECVLVGHCDINAEHFNEGTLHKVDHWQSRWRCEFAVFNISHVHHLKQHLVSISLMIYFINFVDLCVFLNTGLLMTI